MSLLKTIYFLPWQLFTEEKEINWLGSLTRHETGNAWRLRPRCLVRVDHRLGPAFPTTPETRSLNLSCSCSLQPWGLWEAEPGDEGKAASWSGGFHVSGGGESLKPLLSPAQQLNPLTLEGT